MKRSSLLVGLDFGGTLDGSAVAPKFIRWGFYQRDGYDFSTEVLEQAHIHTREQVLAIPNRQAWDISHATQEWFIREAGYLGLDIELARQWATQYTEEKQRRLLAARPAIYNLSRDYRLVLISNNIGNLEQVLTEVGLRTSFQFIVDSSECGYRKPDIKIFYEAQRLGGVTAGSNCWYLGDKYNNDVIPALKAGWNASWLVKDKSRSLVPPKVLLVSSLEEFHCELNKRYRD